MESASENLKSTLSNAFSSLPLSWNTANSGGSRNRPVFRPSTSMKLPHVLPPYARSKPALDEPNVPYDPKTLPVGFVTPCPDRVVATITRLVLPPYSAGGAPAITSSDWMELEGIWLEKTLLCCFVIDTATTEKEFDA